MPDGFDQGGIRWARIEDKFHGLYPIQDYKLISILLHYLEKDSPRAASARRSCSMAFGPMPCHFLTSASLKRVKSERRATPAAASARCAGADSFGRSPCRSEV